MINKLKEQKGFLLIDILFAVFIIGVALVALVAMFMQSSKNTMASHKMAREADIAQDKMRDLQGRSWTELTTGWAEPTDPQTETNINPKDMKHKYFYTLKQPKQRTDLGNHILQLEVVVKREDETQEHSYIGFYTNQ